MYIDTHCHLTDERYDNISETVCGYLRSGVDKCITVSCNYIDAEKSKALAEKFESVYFGVGVHPSDALKTSDADLDKLSAMANHEKCVCVGEIGLDYYWDKSYNERQKTLLACQLELAKRNKLPFSFHSREATFDTLEMLKQNKDKLVYGGVIHCFSGSVETAKELLKLGLKIGVGGTVTFKNAKNIKEVVKYLPLDCIVTETDSPYLSPEPYRGKTNTPENIPIIVDCISKLKGVDIQTVTTTLYNNALEIFTKL